MSRKISIEVGEPTSTPTIPTFEKTKLPSDGERIKQEARYQKRSATERWIAGHIKTAQHEKIHRRADHILAGKKPRQFKGPSGERSVGKGVW